MLGTLAVVGVWLSAKWRDAQTQREGAAWVKQQNGHLSYDFELSGSDGSHPSDAQPGEPHWPYDWLGIDFFSSVHGVILDNKEITDLTPITKLEELRSLAIMTDIMPGTSLQPIAELKHLEKLTLNYTRIDKEELAVISRELPACEVIVGDQTWYD